MIDILPVKEGALMGISWLSCFISWLPFGFTVKYIRVSPLLNCGFQWSIYISWG